MSVDEEYRITRFTEKPSEPECVPGKPDVALASMGFERSRSVEIRASSAQVDSRSRSHMVSLLKGSTGPCRRFRNRR